MRRFITCAVITFASAFYHPCTLFASGTDVSLPGYVTYLVDDMLYIEVVADHHLKPDETGVILLKGREVAYVRVAETGPRYINFQIISQTPGITLNTGDSIVFESRLKPVTSKKAAVENVRWRELDKLILGGTLDQNTTYQISAPWEPVSFDTLGTPTNTGPNRIAGPALPTKEYLPNPQGPVIPVVPQKMVKTNLPSESDLSAKNVPPPSPPAVSTPMAPAPFSETTSSTLKAGSSDQNLAPVLVPLSVAAAAKTGASQDSNIYHGRLRERELYQTNPNPATKSLESRLDFDGSIERLKASPWSMVWSGNESYRNGNSGQGAPDFNHPRLNVYTAMLARKNEDGGSIKMGRFLPAQLPGIGFLDGAQLEHVYSPEWRAGAALALRPDRVTLDLTSKEPLVSAYLSTEQGTRNELYYSASFGTYHTTYRGKSDETALLYDHRVDLGPKLNLFTSSQIDFNDGAQQAHKGPRIIHLDVFGNSPVTPQVSLRAGLSHFERPDIQAERDLTQGTTIGFDNGYWRYFVGANERLPWKFTLDEDLSTINSATSQTDQLWRLTLNHFGFFFMPNAQISISAYNVTSAQGRGFGFQTTASAPLGSDKVNLSLSSSSQYSTPSNSPKNYDINDASIRISWRISKAWNADFGVTQSYAAGAVSSTIGDTSIGYRW